MSDLAHIWANDLGLSSNGDLLLSTDDSLIRERVLRRLLTNPGDYIWHLSFGAGLPQAVGAPLGSAAAAAVIRTHLRFEPSIATSPEPVVDLTKGQRDNPGRIQVDIRYVNKNSGAMNAIQVSPTE